MSSRLGTTPRSFFGTVVALGGAVGFGFVAGVGAAAALLSRYTSLSERVWRFLNSQRTKQLAWPGDCVKLQHVPDDHQSTAPPSEHYVLRPIDDPRSDQTLCVRYDPPANRKTGAIIIVCPGGNYDCCDVHSDEGQPIAHWLAKKGITAVVLQYRCVSQGHYWPAQFYDWQACAQLVQERARSWGCDPERVGVIGFSAGGHLASYAALQSQGAIRPKLQVLVYPAIDTLSPHSGAMDPWDSDQGYPPVPTSGHLLVDAHSPPAFLAGMTSDELTPAKENTHLYADALKRHGVQHQYVIDDESEHGCGLKPWWTKPCSSWLRQRGWAAPPLM